MDLQITGLEQVQRAITELPAQIVVRSFARALDRAAGVIAAEVELRAEGLGESGSDTPLSEHVVTKTEVDTGKRGGVASVGFDTSRDERSGLPQDTKAMLVEFGHQQVTHRPKKKAVGRVPPHPFMRPAFQASGDKAIEVFAATLIEGLSGGE